MAETNDQREDSTNVELLRREHVDAISRGDLRIHRIAEHSNPEREIQCIKLRIEKGVELPVFNWPQGEGPVLSEDGSTLFVGDKALDREFLASIRQNSLNGSPPNKQRTV